MKRFFGIILIIISSITLLISLLMISEGTDLAVFSLVVFFIPGLVVFITGIKMCARPKPRPVVDRYYQHYDRAEEHYVDEYEEPQEPLSVNCSGCGAKVKVYPNLATDCEYCGTTMKIS